MRKIFLAVMVFFTVGILAAQDLPPLPGDDSSASGGLPPLPGADNSAPGGLPPLPGTDNSAPAPGGLPPLPGTDNSAPGGLPPLPGTDNSTPGLPPLPGQESQAPAAPVLSPAPVVSPAPVKAAEKNPDFISKHQPNVIFGGWVNPKGGGAQIRIAWTSQEVLNALDKKGYTVENEKGDYVQNKWRLFTFAAPRSEMSFQVYLLQSGKKVWMRVGPPEAPAGVPLARVERMKAEHLKVLNTLRAQFKGRLIPRRKGRWDSPFDHVKQTADA